MKQNVRERMRAQTAGLRSTTDVKDSEVAPAETKPPRTAPGTLGALTEAQARIKELEKQKAGSRVLAVDSMVPNPWQPRRRFSPEKMDELANGIRESGLIQPIVVRPHPTEPGKYQIVAGERRWRAHKMIGQTEILAHVVEATDAQMAILALIENVNREDLTDFEVSLSVTQIEKEFPSRKAAAEVIGISKSQMQRLSSFTKLPEMILADLRDRPELLGANAANAIVTVLNQHPEHNGEALGEMWLLLKQGEIEQSKLAPLLSDKLANKAARVSTSKHLRSFYSQGSKAGYLNRDAQNFTLRLRASVLTESQEKELYAFLDKLFPAT